MPNITTNLTISYTNFAKVQRPLFNFSKACIPHQRPPEGQQIVSARQWVNPLKKNAKKIREGQNHVQVDSKELFCVLGYETKRGSTVTRVPQFYRRPLIVKIRMPLGNAPFFSEKNSEIFCCFDTSFTSKIYSTCLGGQYTTTTLWLRRQLGTKTNHRCPALTCNISLNSNKKCLSLRSSDNIFLDLPRVK